MKHFSLSAATLALTTAMAATSAMAAPATYAIDPTHTFATFEVNHFGASTVRGRFDKKEGSVMLDVAAKKGKVDITIDVASINTGTAAFDGHLKSKDFLNVEAHPKATFVGDKFVFDGNKVSEVTGTLTLLGKSQPVTLKATGFGCYESPMLKREVCGGDFETTFQRSVFGMGYGIPMIPDMVKMVIQVEAIKQ